jgi:hypothetical protein
VTTRSCFTGAFDPVNLSLEGYFMLESCATADQVNGILNSRSLSYAFLTDTVLNTAFRYSCAETIGQLIGQCRSRF